MKAISQVLPSRTSVVRPLCFLLMAMLPSVLLNAQSVTGQLSGTVTDPGGAIIAGAQVQLTNDLTKQTREFTSEQNGSFVFTGLVPGGYSLHIAQPGFKAFDERGITVSSQEKVDLHNLRLQVGDVNTAIEVSAQNVHVQTDSSDRSVGVNLIQLADTPVRGRDFLGSIKALPGVQDIGTHDQRGWGQGMPQINGGQMGQTLLSLDGIASQDSGNLNPGYVAPSVDAIGEVKLVVSNYTPEYAGRTGGQMLVSVKNGTNEFHGTGYYFWRHEMFNANEFFNNAQRVAKPRYRFKNLGGTFGGPLIIPGTNFNKDRTKLFFFFSIDSIRANTVATNRFTMPTALERQGDFSQTVTSSGALVPVLDPSTGVAFAGNRIPTSRISPAGSAFMNLFALPDPSGYAVDPSGTRQFNAIFNLQQIRPNDDKILRVDYNVGKNTSAYVRLMQDYQATDGYAGPVHPVGTAWGQFPASYHVQAAGFVGTIIHTFAPTLINELTYGFNRGKQGVNSIDDALFAKSSLPLKDSAGNTIPLPSLFKANAQNLLPTVSFGLPSGFSAQSAGLGIANAPTFGHDPRWPFVGTDFLQSFQDKVTWIKGSHTLKAGFYWEHMARNVAVYQTYNPQGTFFFGSDKASPVDTGYPYSNLLTGGFYAYGEDNKKSINHARYHQLEWFLQDSWKVNRRLTIDYGARFYIVGSLRSDGATLNLFQGSAYDAKKVGQLIFPTVIAGQKQGINPVTGAVFPYARQGTFDTASYAAGGIPFSGIKGYDSSIFNTPPVQVGPRIGFAIDVFGDGKTALRGGIGISYGRPWTVDMIGAIGTGNGPLAAPPNLLTPLILNTTISSLANAQAVYTPQNILTADPTYKPPVVYNWSLAVQRDLGKGMIMEVAYIGNVAHRIAQSGTLGGNAFAQDVNAVPLYTTWKPSGCANPVSGGCPNPAYYDPTSSGGGTGGFYGTNLLRALTGYPGWGSIYQYTFVGESYYDALQVSLNKRLSRDLQYGVNYTWSKTLLYARTQYVSDQLNKNVTSRPQAVNFNFGYDVPKFGWMPQNKVLKLATEGWRINGNGTVFYGTALTIGCTATSAPAGYWTGTPNNSTAYIPFRCQQSGDLFLPAGQYPSATADPRLQFPFNKGSFALPGPTTLGIGNTPPTLTYGPGLFNVDMSVSKEFKIAEKRTLEFRGEAFNLLNHFNPGNPNTTLNLNFATGANTNGAFGTITSAQIDARRLIVSARFRF